MSNIKTFIVTSSTPNATGGFVWKLTTTTVAQAFGESKTVKRTYYIGGMPVAGVIGAELKEDINRFEINDREFISEDGTRMMLKWLHVKVA